MIATDFTRLPKRDDVSHEIANRFGMLKPAEERTILGTAFKDFEFAQTIVSRMHESEYGDDKNRIMFMALNYAVTNAAGEEMTPDFMRRLANWTAEEIGAPVRFTESEIESMPADLDEARRYVKVVQQSASARRMLELATWAIDQATNKVVDQSIVNQFIERAANLSPRVTTNAVTFGSELDLILEQEIELRIKAFEAGNLKIPYYPWDTWNQWLRPPEAGKLHVLGAPDGVGKSAYSRAIAANWAKLGFKVVYLFNEDPRDQILLKWLCTASRVDLDRMRRGELSLDEREQIVVGRQKMANWRNNVNLLDAGSMSSLDAVQELRSLRRKGECDIVMVDYIGAFITTRGQSQFTQEWQKPIDDGRRLARFSKDFGVPVMAMAQGTKELLEPGAALIRKHLLGGAQFPQMSQTIVIFSREKLESNLVNSYNEIIAQAGEVSPIVKYNIDKQNDGRQGTFLQYFEGQFFSIYDTEWWRK
jgi:replicative DNA helicase